MCSSTIRFSCARFMMLSLKGARQISGNNVTMSILIEGKHRTLNVRRPTPNCRALDSFAPAHSAFGLPVYVARRPPAPFSETLRRLTQPPLLSFHNLEHRTLAVTCCRTGQQGANSVNGLPRPANHTAHISASKLQLKGDHSAVGNFREHHVIRKFDQLANDELEKFSHP